MGRPGACGASITRINEDRRQPHAEDAGLGEASAEDAPLVTRSRGSPAQDSALRRGCSGLTLSHSQNECDLVAPSQSGLGKQPMRG